MSSAFTCLHCHIRYTSNPRLKTPQKYCNSKSCQQARKNRWEQEKLKIDAIYKAKRKAAKKKWYSTYPGDQYQSTYRATHPAYCKSNREKQYQRNAKGKEITIPILPSGLPVVSPGQTEKIVKTDLSADKAGTLMEESVNIPGLYLLLPYEKPGAGLPLEKIVKTDALIVQIIATKGLQGNILQENSNLF